MARTAPDPAPETDFAADARTVLAALKRMETALRGEQAPSAMQRLREHLAEMARAAAEAKSAIKPDAAASGKIVQLVTLLYQVESRIEEMQALAGAIDSAALAAPSAAPAEVHRPAEPEAFVPDTVDDDAAEDDRVPTVSDVVSRLGRIGEPASSEPSAADHGAETPTIPMLEAMVEALITTAEVAEAGNLAGWAADEVVEASEEPGRAAAEPEPEAARDPPPEPPRDPLLPDIDLLPELDLMSSFARMQSVPHLPPEIGTAVIFPPKEPAAEPLPEEPQAEPSSLAAPPAEAPAVAAEEAAPEPPAEPPVAAASEPPIAAEPPVIALPAAPILLLAPPPSSGAEEPPEAAAPQPAHAAETNGSKPPDFLVEPADADPVPSAFLLEPSDADSEVAAFRQELAPPAPPVRPQLVAGTPLDPLRPLRSLSDEEKIALFS